MKIFPDMHVLWFAFNALELLPSNLSLQVALASGIFVPSSHPFSHFYIHFKKFQVLSASEHINMEITANRSLDRITGKNQHRATPTLYLNTTWHRSANPLLQSPATPIMSTIHHNPLCLHILNSSAFGLLPKATKVCINPKCSNMLHLAAI